MVSICASYKAVGRPHSPAHLLAVDPLQVEVVEAVHGEGAPQSQADHGVSIRLDGQLVETPHLSQRRQLGQTADVGFQEDQVLQQKQPVGSGNRNYWMSCTLYLCLVDGGRD